MKKYNWMWKSGESVCRRFHFILCRHFILCALLLCEHSRRLWWRCVETAIVHSINEFQLLTFLLFFLSFWRCDFVALFVFYSDKRRFSFCILTWKRLSFFFSFFYLAAKRHAENTTVLTLEHNFPFIRRFSYFVFLFFLSRDNVVSGIAHATRVAKRQCPTILCFSFRSFPIPKWVKNGKVVQCWSHSNRNSKK